MFTKEQLKDAGKSKAAFDIHVGILMRKFDVTKNVAIGMAYSGGPSALNGMINHVDPGAYGDSLIPLAPVQAKPVAAK